MLKTTVPVAVFEQKLQTCSVCGVIPSKEEIQPQLQDTGDVLAWTRCTVCFSIFSVMDALNINESSEVKVSNRSVAFNFL